MNVCLVRYNEIGLKGRNQKEFQNLLIKNIKRHLIKKRIKFENIQKSYSRIIIRTNSECRFLKLVFGVSSFSSSMQTGLEINEINAAALALTKNKKFSKFRVSASRANKKFQYNSLQINNLVGSEVNKKQNKKVDLKNFDLDIGIDILDKAYIFIGKAKGPGGLPLGIEGNVISIIKNKKSLLASYLAMKRGCKVIPVAIKKFDINILRKFDGNLKLRIIKSIKDVEKISEENNAKAIVSCQTIDDLEKIKTKLIVLRPLVGLSEHEINCKLDYLNSL